jgi:hypothetical protein
MARKRQPKKPARFNPRTATKRQIAAQLERQREAEKLTRLKKQRKLAIRKFKVAKKDRGKIIFIGIKGKRNPQSKGRKGYLIYVTKKGKKQLVGKEVSPHNIRKSKIPHSSRYRNSGKKFQATRLVKVKRGRVTRPVLRGKGNVQGGKKGSDFNDRVILAISKSVKSALEKIKSHRTFLVQVNVLVELPDGTTRVFSFSVPIERPDHVAIQIGGLENWTRKKFYAYMANELRFEGLVTSGSANHIRRLKENKGRKTRLTKDGQPWDGNGLDVVKILTLEWQILQSK